MFKKKNAPKNLRKRDRNDDTITSEGQGQGDSAEAVPSTTTTESKDGVDRGNVKQGIGVVYSSDRSGSTQTFAGDACVNSNSLDTDQETDRQAIDERNAALRRAGVDSIEEQGSALYKGHGAYKTFTSNDNQTLDQVRSKSTQGPIRAPAFIRTTTVFDYQPDVCKDYKETGFCGFGDSCKFLHDRSDYKTGWQQEQEWDEIQKRKKKKLQAKADQQDMASKVPKSDTQEMLDLISGKSGVDDDDDDDDEVVTGHFARSYSKGLPSQMEQIKNVKNGGLKEAYDDVEELPFACNICRKPFQSPVVTNCGHYFCTRCIITSNKKSSKCPICKKQTGGVFNTAHKILARKQKI